MQSRLYRLCKAQRDAHGLYTLAQSSEKISMLPSPPTHPHTLHAAITTNPLTRSGGR